MNQRRSERFLRSKSMPPQWKECASASLFCNFNVSSLLPTVDLESFNQAHFGHPPKQAESISFVKYLSAEFVEQSRPFQSRPQAPVAKDVPVVRRGGARCLPLRAAQVSIGDVYERDVGRRTTIGDMIKTGQVDRLHGSKPAVDIPEASTSGRVGGDFWNERRRGRNAFDYLPLGTLYNSRVSSTFPVPLSSSTTLFCSPVLHSGSVPIFYKLDNNLRDFPVCDLLVLAAYFTSPNVGVVQIGIIQMGLWSTFPWT